jgi:hypothetical protein
LFLEAVSLDRHRAGQDQQHANAGSRCGIPLLGQVNDGPTQKEPEAETDEHSAENLAPFHPKPSNFSDCGRHRKRLTYAIGEERWLILSALDIDVKMEGCFAIIAFTEAIQLDPNKEELHGDGGLLFAN